VVIYRCLKLYSTFYSDTEVPAANRLTSAPGVKHIYSPHSCLYRTWLTYGTLPTQQYPYSGRNKQHYSAGSNSHKLRCPTSYLSSPHPTSGHVTCIVQSVPKQAFPPTHHASSMQTPPVHPNIPTIPLLRTISLVVFLHQHFTIAIVLT